MHALILFETIFLINGIKVFCYILPLLNSNKSRFLYFGYIYNYIKEDM